MKILILGSGQVGSSLAISLADKYNDITVVDKNQESLNLLSSKIDIRTVNGWASHPDVLAEAGADTADALIALTHVDEVNMTACQIAHELFDIPVKIARVRSTSYYKYEKELFRNNTFPINALISPESSISDQLAGLIEYPRAIHAMHFRKNTSLIAVRATDGAPMLGYPLQQLRKLAPQIDIRIIGIFRNGESLIPSSQTAIQDSDEIYLITQKKDIKPVLDLFRERTKTTSIMIAGGGNIGRRLASRLQDQYLVKIIDKNSSRCKAIAGRLDKAIVICGAAEDHSLLQEENIDQVDVFCAATNSDELNITSCLSAKYLGAQSSIALIKNPYQYKLLEYYKLNIDIPFSPSELTLNTIRSHLQRGNIISSHSVREGQSELIHASIPEESPFIGYRLVDMNFPKTVRFGAILKDSGEISFDFTNTLLEAQDEIIVFLLDRDEHEVVKDLINS